MGSNHIFDFLVALSRHAAMASIYSIPADVLCVIFTNLTSTEVLRNIRVCREWKRVITERYVKYNYIDLSHSKITDAGMIHLQNATSVVLSYASNITDAGLMHLQNATRVVLIHTENITDAGMVYLKMQHVLI